MSAHRRLIPLLTVSAVLADLLAGSLAGTASGQPPDLADDPLVGAWMVTTPIGPALAVFSADGTVVQGGEL